MADPAKPSVKGQARSLNIKYIIISKSCRGGEMVDPAKLR